jgi:hypothetical protein
MTGHVPSPQLLPPIPCLDHGKPESRCKLDLRALAARREDLTKRAKQLRMLLPSAEADCRAPATNVESYVNTTGRLHAIRGELHRVTRELRIIYAVRAHHRGRVHESKRHRSSCTAELTHTGAITLEHQAYEIAPAWVNRYERRATVAAE